VIFLLGSLKNQITKNVSKNPIIDMITEIKIKAKEIRKKIPANLQPSG